MEPTPLAVAAELPREATIVVIGAGIVGASIAYHLAERGWRDVVVVDQGPIPATGGSTSHAPGGVFVTNYSRSMTRLALETVDLMNALDLDGKPCFLPVGTIEVARTQGALAGPPAQGRRRPAAGASRARGSSIPRRPAALVPLLDPGEILGSYHVPIDGIGKPLRAVEAMLRRRERRGRASGRVDPGQRVRRRRRRAARGRHRPGHDRHAAGRRVPAGSGVRCSARCSGRPSRSRPASTCTRSRRPSRSWPTSAPRSRPPTR